MYRSSRVPQLARVRIAVRMIVRMHPGSPESRQLLTLGALDRPPKMQREEQDVATQV